MIDQLPVVVYDANVLYPAFLRDVLLRIAVAELVDIRWTDRIHDEWTRSLLRDRPDLNPERVVQTRDIMKRAFPRALVTGYEELLSEINLPDPDDCHVLAAARHAQASYIVTHNLQHFPATILGQLGVEPISPDALIMRLLNTDFETVARTLERHRSILLRPSMTSTEYLAALHKAGLTDTSVRIRESIGA